MTNLSKKVTNFIKAHFIDEDVNIDPIEGGHIIASSSKTCYINEDGQLHRDGEPALYTAGLVAHYQNGKIHNDNGFAKIMKSGTSCYYSNGMLHNPNGAAIVHKDGQKEYFVNGHPVTKEFKKWASKKKLEAQEEDFIIFMFEKEM